MRYILVTLIIVSLILFSQTVLADERMKEKLIESYQVDITQNGAKESIQLKGTSLSPQSAYYPRIWSEIKANTRKDQKIEFGGGYRPVLKFIDYNHNKTKDILYQSSTTKKSSGVNNYKLYTVNEDNIEETHLPKQEYVDLLFKNNFKLDIKLSPQLRPSSVNVSNISAELTRLGIFSEKGEVLKEKPVIKRQITSFDPLKLNNDKGYGLKSKMELSLSSSSTRIGTIETIWYFEDGKWIILKSEWMSS